VPKLFADNRSKKDQFGNLRMLNSLRVWLITAMDCNGPQWTATEADWGTPDTRNWNRDGVSCGNRKGDRLKHERLSWNAREMELAAKNYTKLGRKLLYLMSS